MHIVLGVIALVTTAYFLVLRARNAAEMSHELLDMADDVRAAARRLGFRRNKAQHPMDAVEDPNTAAAAIAVSYLELDDLPTAEQRGNVLVALQSALEVDKSQAEELMVLGRWLMTQCNGPVPAITRAARNLYRMTGGDPGPMMQILTAASTDPISDKQRDALGEIKRAFRIT